MAEGSRNKCEEAVLYMLKRIQECPNTRYYCGPGSQAFYLLCQAEAEITGEPLATIEKERAVFLRPHDSESERDALWKELEEMREKL